MQEVKRIFHEKYQDCEIAQRQEYKLGKIESPTLYSVDRIFGKSLKASGKRCDEFVFFNLDERSTGIYLIERKDNYSNNVSKVREQLQGGAKFIEDFLKNDPATDKQPYDFMPVWVSKGIRKSASHNLKKQIVTICLAKKYIRHRDIKDELPKLAR